jgi:hypothetical protein
VAFCITKRGKEERKRQWIEDTTRQQQIVSSVHEAALGGCHFGRDKTCEKVLHRYFWHGIGVPRLSLTSHLQLSPLIRLIKVRTLRDMLSCITETTPDRIREMSKTRTNFASEFSPAIPKQKMQLAGREPRSLISKVHWLRCFGSFFL